MLTWLSTVAAESWWQALGPAALPGAQFVSAALLALLALPLVFALLVRQIAYTASSRCCRAVHSYVSVHPSPITMLQNLLRRL